MRISSFLPSATEIVYGLGLADSLHGVRHECDYPEAARSKPRVVKSRLDSSRLTSREVARLVSEIASRGERIYHVDLDVLDPSVMAAVGTPEPGGMAWSEATALLRAVAEQRHVVGFDVTELRPGEGPEAGAFTAAKLVYKLIGYAIPAGPVGST